MQLSTALPLAEDFTPGVRAGRMGVTVLYRWARFLDYRLSPELEREFQDHTHKWINKTLSVGIPVISVFAWLFYFTYRESPLAPNIWNFVVAGQVVLAIGFITVGFKGRARNFASYCTPIFPTLYVYGLMTFHIPKLPEVAAMNQAQNWILWLVFLIYAFERLTPIFALINSFFATATFFYLKGFLPEMAQQNYLQLSWQVFAVHVTGLLLCVDHCRNARQQFKLKKDLETERQQTENLLKNVLPEAVVRELKTNLSTIAHYYSNVTVLFADLVGFTRKASSTDPQELVKLLNELFSRFDELAAKCGVEKIKTIGDAYMAATGCPEADSEHAVRMVVFAMQLEPLIKEFNKEFASDFSVKVGISSGSVMGGVIGKKRVSFDLWGDVVNLASRIESVSSGGQVAVSESTAKLIQGSINLSSPMIIDLKGKGLTPIFFVLDTVPTTNQELSRDSDQSTRKVYKKLAA